MKTLFVVLPQCIEKALEATAKIALAASTELGEYLQLISNSAPYGWGMYFENSNPQETIKRNELAYLAKAIESMSSTDYVAFAPNWQKYKECRVLHDIAEQYELDIIECDVPEPELKTGLKPCPFCEDEMLTCACENTEHGKEYSVFCSTCGTSGPTANSESDAIELWNSRGQP